MMLQTEAGFDPAIRFFMHDVCDTIVVAHTYAMRSAEAAAISDVQHLAARDMARSLGSGILLRSGFVEPSSPYALHCGRSPSNMGTSVAEG